MSHTVSSAMVPPTSASISTPVRSTVSAWASTRTPRRDTVNSTAADVSGTEWQWGMESRRMFHGEQTGESPAAIGSPLAIARVGSRCGCSSSRPAPAAAACRATRGYHRHPPDAPWCSLRGRGPGRDVREDRFQLDPVRGPLRQPEIDLAEVLDQTDLLAGRQNLIADIREIAMDCP